MLYPCYLKDYYLFFTLYSFFSLKKIGFLTRLRLQICLILRRTPSSSYLWIIQISILFPGLSLIFLTCSLYESASCGLYLMQITKGMKREGGEKDIFLKKARWIDDCDLLLRSELPHSGTPALARNMLVLFGGSICG